MPFRRSRLAGLLTSLVAGCCLGAAAAEAQHAAPGDAPGTAQQGLPAQQASAQPALPALANPAARRFPQLVRAGDLVGRQLLRPVEQQNVLGRIAGLARRADGGILLVVNTGGIFGLGTRPVAVPLDAAALLGEHVALMDVTPEQLRALPDFAPAGTAPVPADEAVRVGLVGPFH